MDDVSYKDIYFFWKAKQATAISKKLQKHYQNTAGQSMKIITISRISFYLILILLLHSNYSILKSSGGITKHDKAREYAKRKSKNRKENGIESGHENFSMHEKSCKVKKKNIK